MGLGFDASTLSDRLSAFLTDRLRAPSRVVSLSQFSGGFSWPTYRFQWPTYAAGHGGARHYIPRIGHPDGHLAPYSAAPEFLCFAAFRGSSVPVPLAHWHSDDTAIIGAPFLICDKVEGKAPAPWHFDHLDQTRIDTLSKEFVTHIANIHNFPWQDSPLREIGPDVTRQNATLSQIEQWEKRIDRTALQPFPVIRGAAIWLKKNYPAAPRLSVVHGDYRLGNFLEKDGKITAILDWELAHIGDPYEDLGWACARIFTSDRNKVSNLGERRAFLNEYSRLTGLTPSEEIIRYYEVMAIFKIVAINLGGIHNFYMRPGVNPKIGAVGNQLPIHMRLLNKMVRDAS